MVYYILAFVIGFVAGGVYVEWTWDEELERQKMEFDRNKKDVRF